MPQTQPVRVRVGVFELDLNAGQLRATGEAGAPTRIVLQQQPLRVLSMLLERAGQVVTRDEIQKRLWPNDTVVEFEHSINAAIAKLRKAFGDSANEPGYIETIAKRGYRLIAPTEWLTDSGDSSFTGIASSRNGAAARMQPESAGLTGRIVSHYRVLDIIGGGGMGVVYRAEDLKLGRQVALKFLPEEVGDDPKALERFEREARAASALDHPNICSIYEFGEHNGQPFIVMQLLEGQTLREYLASVAMQPCDAHGASRAPFPLEERLDLAGQIAVGLQAAHERGIVHRDIKPANIFITRRGLVKILDFGVAKLAEAPEALDPVVEGVRVQDHGSALAALTHTGLAMGTVGYMSPEQVRGEKVDARTDIFSFGVVLYEMVTGQRAFNGETAELIHGAILNQTPAPAHELNAAIPHKLEQIINRAIEKDPEQRYQTVSEMAADLQFLSTHQPRKTREIDVPKRSRWQWLVGAVAALAVAAIAAGLHWRVPRRFKFTGQDAIVIADFENATGDPAFDDALKQGLMIQLGQSPFLDLISDRRVNQTLKEMGRHANDRLTADIAHEVCLRTNSGAMLFGSIVAPGTQYIIRLKMVDCNSGGVLAETQEQAANRAAVLQALGTAASSLRNKLGESLVSLQKYNTPLVEATTPSLEALKAYSLALKTTATEGFNASLPLYKRAIELDANFALPYAVMAGVYDSLNEPGQAATNARMAYERRYKVSQRERLSIELSYYLYATGELDKAAQTGEALQQIYPKDYTARMALGYIFMLLGSYEQALQEQRVALGLEPDNVVNYLNLGATYMALNWLDQAEIVYKEAELHKLSGEELLAYRYQLSFLKGDRARMEGLVSHAMGRPGTEDLLLADQAQTYNWNGQSRNARRLFQQAIASAGHNDAKETAAMYLALMAVSEVDFGNRRQLLTDANSALIQTPNRDVRAIVALAQARIGNTDMAEKLVEELESQFPLDTLVQHYWLPTIRAAIALERKDPNHAVELLNGIGTIELGTVSNAPVFLCPVYVRGEAYLKLRDSKAAVAEFQKFIDHYGLVGNFPWGALARLGLARAYALEAKTDPPAREKARNMYQDFLTIWKDADPDIPIYKQAKAEYAKLQ